MEFFLLDEFFYWFLTLFSIYEFLNQFFAFYFSKYFAPQFFLQMCLNPQQPFTIPPKKITSQQQQQNGRVLLLFAEIQVVVPVEAWFVP
mgnify:CR=1 FL=1